MRRLSVVFLARMALCSSAIWADEGRIPIFQPTTITQPGHYILTRDISTSGDGIHIQAINVILDLNGHTIASTGAAARLIQMDGPSTNIRIRNGRLTGGLIGIQSTSLSVPPRVHVERVEIVNSDAGIQIVPAEHVEIISCRILATPGSNGAGILVQGVPSGSTSLPWTGRFIDNTVVGASGQSSPGISLLGIVSGEIRENIVRNHSGIGIDIPFSGGTGGGNRIESNQVSNGKAGILVGTNGNVVAENVVKDNLGTFGYVVRISGARNLIERNQLEGNGGCGIEFSAVNGNAYRDNMLRSNAGGAVCGPINTDGGGNIL